ncbi:MAG: GspE/PulE family protein [Pseudomonadota bacterium]
MTTPLADMFGDMDSVVNNAPAGLSDGERLFALLATREVLPGSDLARAAAAAAETGVRLDKTLLTLGLVTEDALADLLAEGFGLARATAPLRAVATDLDPGYLKGAGLVPIAEDATSLTVASADPLDRDMQLKLAFFAEKNVRVAVATPAEIETALGTVADAAPAAAPLADDIGARDADLVRARATEGPVIRMVQELLTEAVDRGASDIHFEARPDGVAIRLRLSGDLTLLRVERTVSAAALLSRIKVLANLNISERRLPQDGRIREVIRGREVDYRLSTLPIQHGESAVLRVLDRDRLRLDLDALGLPAEIVSGVRAILAKPDGLFLVTGPTGSGKTTTLYACLAHLNREDVKVVTVEDPVEYELEGLAQVQVHAGIGLTFAAALRAVLRQDPNIVMVGEIRDRETAEMACRAALIGRLVLSTLHVSRPEEAVTRLVDLGVDRYIVDAVLRGVLAQRLERGKLTSRLVRQ